MKCSTWVVGIAPHHPNSAEDCDKPPVLTQAHHIQHHANGGLTVEDNMVLLCAHHHTLIHHTEWQVRIQHGKPAFNPPEYRVA
ncbi:HNH endonuclease signature motif containing protein [Sciscionella sediminilitoris]|uniref:HNH endonuclease signature motif containing protein n=1 Tax=Sciscionella sediminilitoris TaxID=1445613 RepID=UPI0031B5982E